MFEKLTNKDRDVIIGAEVPISLKRQIHERMKAEGYSTISEFIREALRARLAVTSHAPTTPTPTSNQLMEVKVSSG